MMGWVIVHDEYDGDRGLTDWPVVAKVEPFAWCKGEEGLGSSGNEAHWKDSLQKAHAAGMQLGAYDWPLFHTDGAAQAEKFLSVCGGADAFACDLEAGDQPSGVTKADILNVMHAWFDRFHALKPSAVVVVYGSSLMDGLGVHWDELVGNRAWVLGAWLPRYSGGGDIRQWSDAQVVDYATNLGFPAPYRDSIPHDKIALVQYTDGKFGPIPHTLNGLNRNEDLSVLRVPLSALTGQGADDLSVLSDDQQNYLVGLMRRFNMVGPPDASAPQAQKDGFAAADKVIDAAMTNPKPTPQPPAPHDHPTPAGRTGKNG